MDEELSYLLLLCQAFLCREQKHFSVPDNLLRLQISHLPVGFDRIPQLHGRRGPRTRVDAPRRREEARCRHGRRREGGYNMETVIKNTIKVNELNSMASSDPHLLITTL